MKDPMNKYAPARFAAAKRDTKEKTWLFCIKLAGSMARFFR